MKKIIIRKPKFLRNDIAMQTHLDVAASISKVSCKSDITEDERYELLMKVGECINKAAKAGGFLNTKDFINWVESHG